MTVYDLYTGLAQLKDNYLFDEQMNSGITAGNECMNEVS